MTIKLYDTDSFIRTFSATVISCEPAGDRFAIVLDQTAFFPEGGGQAGDSGKIGSAIVYDTQIKDGIIYHYANGAVPCGSTAVCEIDFKTRFVRMQNHTGEHIVSGILFKEYGIENVGFHLGSDHVTIDTSRPLNSQMIEHVETIANRAVYECVEVVAEYPEPEKLAALSYRSKLELERDVRIVTIGEYDTCACCAPHVKNTGQIGMIKLLDCSNYKGGSRIKMVCGDFALSDYRTKFANISAISALLSAKQEQTAAAVEKLIAQKDELELYISQLKKEICRPAIEGLRESDRPVVVFGNYDREEQRHIANAASKLCPICGIFSGSDSSGYDYTVIGQDEVLAPFIKEMNQTLNGRGGGRNGMAQGKVSAKREEIQKFFENHAE